VMVCISISFAANYDAKTGASSGGAAGHGRLQPFIHRKQGSIRQSARAASDLGAIGMPPPSAQRQGNNRSNFLASREGCLSLFVSQGLLL